MIRITRQGATGADAQLKAHHYSMGGQRVVFDASVETLHAYSEGLATDRYSDLLRGLPAPMELLPESSKDQYYGTAPFAGELQKIRCWTQSGKFQLDIEGEPRCRIDLDKKHIRLLSDESYDQRLNLEIVTGPALMIALAARQIYCLHAGAINTDHGAIAFIAESGVGKSTLSADGDEGSELGWRQVCDDIMPLEQIVGDQGSSFHLHDFPQLKLPNSVAPLRPRGQIKLSALFRLTSVETDKISFRRLDKTEALLQIVRHTVAAKLFDNQMMKNHARFAKRLSTAVPVVEVSYPRDLNQLSEVRAAILAQVDKESKAD